MKPLHPMSINVNTRMRWAALKKLGFIKGCRDRNVLDLAAGLGFFSVQLADLGARVLAADVHEGSLKYLSNNYGLEVAKTNLETDEYPEGLFDLIFLGEVLEHVHDPEAVAVKAAARLAPGGVLLVTTPALEGPLIDTPGKRLGHSRGPEKHEREGFALPELQSIIQKAGLKAEGHLYSIFYLSELFMQLTKLVYLLKNKSYDGQSDMVGSMRSLSYRALRVIYAALHPVFLAEEWLCRKLGLHGNCHIIWAAKQ